MFGTNSRAARAEFTGVALKLWVGTYTLSTLTDASTVTHLFVTSPTGRVVQRAVTRTACVVSVTDTFPTHTPTMT